MTPKQVLLPYAGTSLLLVISEIINLYIKQISPNYFPLTKKNILLQISRQSPQHIHPPTIRLNL